VRRIFVVGATAVLLLNGLISLSHPAILFSMIIFAPLLVLGAHDLLQKKHAVLRNFPIIGHFRYFAEAIRPEISQYFIETETNGVPFNREQRSVVYQRAKNELDTVPFGTKLDVYATGYEWVNHSLRPIHLESGDMRVVLGDLNCKNPYSASRLNISAMSFGALSKNAVLALNQGAKIGKFAHNTGEGGISPYHLQSGGDLIWQVGTGYFGCRDSDGNFCSDRFAERANLPNVKMIEIKLSQGAKPGHGGILPAAKLTREIAEIRGVPMGKDVLSPSAHSVFSTPIDLLEFVSTLRRLSGGKPVGFKLCVGKRREFLAICKAMVKTGITPDFITVDGGEGGTGAAPMEFTDHIGAPLSEGLIFVHNALVGFSLRKKVHLISSGKVTSGFEIVKQLALGADMVNSARGMMMALGCIQALRCNSNHCPVGVTTQNPQLVAGLVPEDKSRKVANFHFELLNSTSEIMGAMGITSPDDLQPWHIMRRTSPTTTRHYGEIFEFLDDGDLMGENIPESYKRAVIAASADHFDHESRQ